MVAERPDSGEPDDPPAAKRSTERSLTIGTGSFVAIGCVVATIAIIAAGLLVLLVVR